MAHHDDQLRLKALGEGKTSAAGVLRGAQAAAEDPVHSLYDPYWPI